MSNSPSLPFNALIIIVGIFSLIMLSCRPSKKTMEARELSIIPFEQLSQDSMLSNVRHTNAMKYLKAKGKAHYKDNTEDAEFGISLFSVKDSAALIIIKKLGIEVSRVLLNKSQYQILDRVHQNYLQGPYDHLPYALFTLLGLSTLQDILTSCSSCPQNLIYSFEEEAQFYNLKGISDSLQISNKFSKINLHPKQCHLLLTDATTRIECRELFSLYGYNIPKQIYISSVFKSSTDHHYLKIKWDYVELNPLNELKFNVPDHYSRI